MATLNGIKLTDSSIPEITVDFESGDSVGDSSNNRYNWGHIVEKNNSEGWGLLDQFGNIIICRARVLITGVDTYFSYASYKVNWRGTIDATYVFEVNNDADMFYDDSFSYTENIGQFLLYSDNISGTNIFAQNLRRLFLEKGTYDSVYASNFNAPLYLTDGSYTNINLYKVGALIDNPAKLESFKSKQANDAIQIGDSSTALERLDIIDAANDLRFRTPNDDVVVDTFNSRLNIDSYAIHYTGWTGDCTVRLRQYIQIKIKNGNGATATLYDKDGNEVASSTLDSEGKWDTNVIYAKRYVSTDGSGVDADEKTEYKPFKLVVKQTGLQDLIIPNIYCSIYDSEKGKRIGSLEDTVIEGQMVGHNYIHDRIQQEIAEDKIEFQLKEEKIEFVAYDTS